MAMSVQQGDLPQEENTMKRLFAGTLALVMTCGLLFSGCGKQMTPEEEAASQEAAISQQLQDEENKTGLKRLISNNLTEYEQPVHDFIEGLQDGDAEKTAMALGVPNTFGEKLQDWVVVNDFETFQKTDMTNICLNSAKEGSKAAINVFMKTPGEVTADTSPDYTLTAEYTNGAWVLNPPTGILTDYSFTVPNNKVSFQGTDLSSYTAKNAEIGVWTVTLPRALDLDSDAAYVISTDMGDFNGRVYQIAADGNKKQMLLADIDSDTRDAYQSKLSAVMKEVYRLLSIGAGESDFSNVLLDSNEISNCVPEPVDSDDDVEAIQANADKKALGASVTSITVTPDDTIEGYPDAYTYRLDGNDGVKMNVKLKVSTTNGDAHMKDTLNKGIESQDDETIQKSKMLVRSAIKKIYTERYPKSKKCVVCGETCGTSGLCRKCWRALSNNAVLRSEGHTQKDRVANQQGPCIVCGRTPVLCRKVCNRCYAKMRAHKFTTTEQLMEYIRDKKQKK